MKTLEAQINSFNFPTQLEAVKSLLDTAQTRITFWGTRAIEVNGTPGYVSLDNLAERMLKISDKDREKLTPAERVAGIEIARKLKTFYEITDIQFENSNFLTRIFSLISRIFNCFSQLGREPTRAWFKDGRIAAEFRTYSKDMFIKQFGGTVEDIRNNPAYLRTECHDEVCVKEDHLRAQMVRV